MKAAGKIFIKLLNYFLLIHKFLLEISEIQAIIPIVFLIYAGPRPLGGGGGGRAEQPPKDHKLPVRRKFDLI